ncbi:MAG: TatD family hydrolase [Myxococcaceae bacterium]
MADLPPPLFDAQLDPWGLSDEDLGNLRFFGLEAAVLAASSSPGHATPRAIFEHFEALVRVQLPRFERAGIRAFAALGVHPRGLPRRGLSAVLSELPGYFQGGRVVAVGEIGLALGGEAEEEALSLQLALARRLNLPVLVHTPRKNKEPLTRRALNLLRASGLPASQVLVNHVSAKTVRLALECGHFAALTVHPDELAAEEVVQLVRRYGSERLVLDSGHGGEMLGLARVAARLVKAGLTLSVVERVARENATELYRVKA